MPIDFNKAIFETSFGNLSQFNEDDDFMEIAFAGRSNVGKSSIINKIFGRKALARVSSVPGKTVTINFFKLTEDVRIVDLPGYGYAKVSKNEKRAWSDLIGGYYSLDRNLVLTVLLIDSRHAPSAQDLQMINYLVDEEHPFIIALTKTDKMNKTEYEKRMFAFKNEIPYFDDITVVATSSNTGKGIDEIQNIILEVTGYSEK